LLEKKKDKNYLTKKMIPLLKFFSADGNYEVTLMTKATVYFDGRVIWGVKLKNIVISFFWIIYLIY